jgi:hypothetical protein
MTPRIGLHQTQDTPESPSNPGRFTLLWFLARTGREKWFVRASEITYERPMTPEEAAAEGML